MAPSLSIGIIFYTEFNSLLESSMTLILPEAEDTVRMLVSRLDQTDEAIFQCQIRLQASKVDGIELRADEMDALETAYYGQATRLADTLHAPLFPYSARFQGRGSLMSGPQTGMVARH
jgi:hypothetical protein